MDKIFLGDRAPFNRMVVDSFLMDHGLFCPCKKRVTEYFALFLFYLAH